MSLFWNIGLFVAGAVAIGFGGRALPDAGNRLAAKLGISATAIGLFVLSVVTSLPELSVTIAAMLKEGAPNLAFGNILGSNNFNATSLVIMEIAATGIFLHNIDRYRYTRTCLYLLILTAIAGLGVALGPKLADPSMPAFLRHPVLPPLLFSLPIVAIFVHDSVTHREPDNGEPRRRPARGTGTDVVVWKFAGLSAAVVLGGFAIATGANGIAVYEFPGGLTLGATFVGTLLVAVATSMPEVSVAYSAIRRAKLEDMALGTLLGSNTLNIMVFAIGAPLLAFRSGASAWSHLLPSNLVSVGAAIVLTIFVLVGINSPRTGIGVRVTRLLLALMIPVYLVCLYLVYKGTV